MNRRAFVVAFGSALSAIPLLRGLGAPVVAEAAPPVILPKAVEDCAPKLVIRRLKGIPFHDDSLGHEESLIYESFRCRLSPGHDGECQYG